MVDKLSPLDYGMKDYIKFYFLVWQMETYIIS